VFKAREVLFEFISQLLFVICYKVLIDIVYIYTIAPNFIQFDDNLDFSKYIISYILVLCSFWFIFNIVKNKPERISTFLLYILYLFSYIPTCSLYALSDLPNNFIILFNIYWMLIYLFMYSYSKLKTKKLKTAISSGTNKIVLTILFGVFGVFGVYFSYKYSGFNITFDLLDVYGIRADYKELKIPTLHSLFYYMVSVVIYPLFASYFYINKKWIRFFTVLFLQLLMFSVAGHKFYFFIIPAGIILFHFYTKNTVFILPKLLVILILVLSIEFIFLETYIGISLFVRRLLYVPALLDYLYFDFFINNPVIYFTEDKIISRLGFESPYSKTVSQVIGNRYMNNSNANTGLFGDAIANLGYFSVIIFPFFYLFFMMLADLITSKTSNKYITALIVSFTVALLNGQFLNLLYTLIVPMGLIFLFLDNNMYRKSI